MYSLHCACLCRAQAVQKQVNNSVLKKLIVLYDFLNLASLAKPHSIKWHIIGDSLVLTWVYRKTAILPKGYYIHVQEAPWPQGVFGHVSYIHVKNPSAQSADLRGLKPNTRYYVKVLIIIIIIVYFTKQ